MTDEDIREVMDEEAGRGRRRPTEFAARKERRQKLGDMHALLTLRTKEEFEEGLKRYGLVSGTPEFDAALRAWNAFRASSRGKP
jgi:hypothetical protein